ncbi:MAG: hypothetical protein N2593_00950, partial [Patescibacteria group bacterium]|nr:hypothetical protein [Patescibacteria group bacterium]
TQKDNSVNEKFNRTIKDEFMETDKYFKSLLTEADLLETNKRLTGKCYLCSRLIHPLDKKKKKK